MIRLIGIVAAIVLTAGSAHSQQDCRAIKDNLARLDCYDKQVTPVPATPPRTAVPKSEAPKTDPNIITDAGWQFRKSKDNFSDKLSCVISPAGKPHVQVNVGSIYISYRGRGGVQGFQYRIDDLPESGMQLPTDIEKQIGAIAIKGSHFDRVLSGSRLRVSTLTLVSGIQQEDLALAGMTRLYPRMVRECPK